MTFLPSTQILTAHALDPYCDKALGLPVSNDNRFKATYVPFHKMYEDIEGICE